MIVRDMLTNLLKSPVTVFVCFKKKNCQEKNISPVYYFIFFSSNILSVNLVVSSVPRMDDRLGKSNLCTYIQNLFFKVLQGSPDESYVLNRFSNLFKSHDSSGGTTADHNQDAVMSKCQIFLRAFVFWRTQRKIHSVRKFFWTTPQRFA